MGVAEPAGLPACGTLRTCGLTAPVPSQELSLPVERASGTEALETEFMDLYRLNRDRYKQEVGVEVGGYKHVSRVAKPEV